MLAAISVDVGMRGGRIGNHGAMQVMGMVVMVVINRQALGILAEQLDEGRVAADLFRVAGAADVAIEAH
ncbi:hypothetical protein, partial [Colwellia sp. TT2012]|uniref:hypothetical protein n=1 Tax=Colwellia sp. TT2012 TaxID=1720342 RepID=UPI00070B7B61